MKWTTPWRLSRHGILGMNCRNRDFIGRYNPRGLYPRVDNKLKTKLLAQSCGLATPTLLRVVGEQHSINGIDGLLRKLQGFAIKPARGAGGKGIMVIAGQEDERFIKASGAAVAAEDIRRHLSNVLAGLYSLGGKADVAIIEELIRCDDGFAEYSCQGVPDIRVVVFRGFPVMAMMRLATRVSDGKANLHQGAIGVGLDIGSGRCLKAVQFSRPLNRHPDTGSDLQGLRVPQWRELLLLAARCYEMSGLGYIGTDIVLDKRRGPLLLELNARPGLAIQMANGAGLLPRLRRIEALADRPMSPEQRVEFAMREFSPGSAVLPSAPPLHDDEQAAPALAAQP